MYNILVCDDERDIVSAIRIYLTGEGYHVLEAYSGAQALEVIQQEKVDLVLMDIQMPKMDGYAATRQIRTLPSDVANVPIVAMTADAFAEDVERTQAAGMRSAGIHGTRPSR